MTPATADTVLGWDEWRTLYDTATLDDQKRWHRDFAAAYPDQHHFNEAAVYWFLSTAMPRTVLEVGGFDGELASRMLNSRSWIGSWTNLDLTEGVRHVCVDRRYTAPRMAPVAV